MRNHLIVLTALTGCFLWSEFASGAEPLPPTPNAPKSNGTTSGGTARETRGEHPGAPAAAPEGAAPTAEPAQATDVLEAGHSGALIAADLQLLKRLHEDNQNEIELGKLVREKGAVAQTRTFGKVLVDDHLAAEKKIATFLKRKKLDMNILVAVKTNAPPDQDLGAKSGNDFDRAFAALMVEGHSKAIEAVKERREKTTDRQLKTLLSGFLPVLQRHLKSAESIANRTAKM